MPVIIPEHMARFILERDLCVLSTSSPQGAPHASLMAYAAGADLRYIHMATPANSRKWANLSANPRAALLLDDRDAARGRSLTRALTVGGDVDPALAPEEKREILTALGERFGHLKVFFARPDMEVIRFRPRWLLLLSGAEQSEFIELKNN